MRLLRAGLAIAVMSACGPVLAEGPATQKSPPTADAAEVASAWGEKIDGFQARVIVKGKVARGGGLQVVAEVKNVSGAKARQREIRVWLMLAQAGADGKPVMFYTAPYTATPKTFDVGEVAAIPVTAGELHAFDYAPNLELHDGLPVAAGANTAPPKSVGKVSEIMAAGSMRVKGFVVLSQAIDSELKEKLKAEVIATPAVQVKVAQAAPADLAAMDEAGKKAFVADLLAGFRADAVSAKAAHDRAVKAGTRISGDLVAMMEDAKLSSAGQMWLAATLVDLKDPKMVDPLIKILEKGGAAARVVAYHGPKLKDAKLTSAIEKAAITTKDPGLTAWAARGLGVNGENVDGGILEAMVAHSDPLGRAEAAGIIAGHSDPRSAGLLAKLIGDDDKTVRAAAIRAAVEKGRKDKEVMDALAKAASMKDVETSDAAKRAAAKLAG